MKKIFALILLALVVFGFCYFNKNKDQKDLMVNNTTPESVSTPSSQKRCFTYSRLATKDAPYSSSEYLEITIDGKNVSGIKRGNQSGPDMTNGYEGTLSGTATGDILKLVYSYIIEGSSQKEEEEYLLTGDSLVRLAYKLKEDNGILVLDKTTMPSELVYNQTQCL